MIMIELRNLILTAALLAALTGPAGAATDSALAEQLFRGFATCTPDAAAAARDALLQRGTPTEKTDAYWRYTVDFTVLGLPAKALDLGVCNITGEQGCGWAAYQAAVLALPLAEARTRLRRATGIDFTQERRDPRPKSPFSRPCSKATIPAKASCSAIRASCERAAGLRGRNARLRPRRASGRPAGSDE
jgi:hypothetical protein